MTAKDFLFALPAKVNPAALEGLETVFHFNLQGEKGGQYTVSLADQKLNVNEGLQGEPKCVINTDEQTFVDLVTGKLNPMLAVLTGKIKISNQGELLRYAKIFGLM